jgi:hypothetical protein
MKKIFTFLSVLLMGASVSTQAQDTLLYEGFQADSLPYILIVNQPPPANIVDSMWYSYDGDQFDDGSPSGNRPGSWNLSMAFANADSIDLATGDTNLVLYSNSWFTNPDQANNWFITRNIQLGDHDTLFWKSAPVQTPRYLDGYEVLLSTTNNEDLSFSEVLFTAAEMTVLSTIPGDSAIFANHEFSTGFVHGLDSTYIEADTVNLTSAYAGILRPFSVPLDAYANQNVFIAFHHNSYDDNLISIDDILIRGTPSNPAASINELGRTDLSLNVFPNPAVESAQINFKLASETEVTITVADVSGKVIYSENKGSMVSGRHFAMINTSTLAKGFYTIAVKTNNSTNTTKLIVK